MSKSNYNIFKTQKDFNKTIGVVFPFFWSGNSSQLLNGIRDASEKFKTNLLFFQGFYCNVESYFKSMSITIEKAGNVVYDLIDKKAIDGLIISTGGFKTHADKLTLIEMCKKFLPLPMVSIGAAVDGMVNILIDNKWAMWMILDHLVNVHHRKKIAILRGPEDNEDANERFNAYCDYLYKQNIEIKPEWISSVNIWNDQLASEAVKDIIKKTHNEIDAFICNGDNLAFGVVETLKAINIKIPKQISVFGFNNDPIADACFPPISTVDRRLYNRGWKAVESIIDSCNGQTLSNNLPIKPKIILRQSCGCLYPSSKAIKAAFERNLTKNNLLFDANDDTVIIKREIEKVLEAPDNTKVKEWCNVFVDSFIMEINGLSTKKFLCSFDNILHECSMCNFEMNLWYDAFNVLELISIKNNSSTKKLKEKLLNQAKVFLSEKAALQQKRIILNNEEKNEIINTMSHAFSKASEIKTIVELLAGELPKLGISACYLSLYDDPKKPKAYSRLVLGYNSQGRITIPEDGIRFKTIDLLPVECNHPEEIKKLFIEPLYYGNNYLGFTLFEFDKKSSSFYEHFPSQLSAALWSAILNKKLRKAEEILKRQTLELKASNKILHQKISQLEDASKQINENQDKLLLSDKMASLGKLTAGIVHEMNTPLATVRASISELENLVDEYEQSIDDTRVTNNDHQQIAADIMDSIKLAKKATLRATEFIKSIKGQTRDVKTEEAQMFNILEILHGVITFLAHSIKHSNCKVYTQSAIDKIDIYGSPTKMTQVFTNLITNSIDALEGKDNKEIIIKLDVREEHLNIQVKDNGCGIPKENMTKIFESLFTTKSFGHGTGLGLSIIADIIKNDFNGTISVESDLGKGTTFKIDIAIT